jgi:hypothetical protein
LPSDPNELVDMLTLLVTIFSAGNLVESNEIITIADEIRKLGGITDVQYKFLMLLIGWQEYR